VGGKKIGERSGPGFLAGEGEENTLYISDEEVLAREGERLSLSPRGKMR